VARLQSPRAKSKLNTVDKNAQPACPDWNGAHSSQNQSAKNPNPNQSPELDTPSAASVARCLLPAAAARHRTTDGGQ
jgi:hypothetical protein